MNGQYYVPFTFKIGHMLLFHNQLRCLYFILKFPVLVYNFTGHCLSCGHAQWLFVLSIVLSIEDLEYVLLNCPVLSSVRDEYFNIVSKQSSDYYIGVDFMEQSPSAKLQFIVGDIGYAFNNDVGIFYDFVSVKCKLKHVLDYEVKYCVLLFKIFIL